MQNKSQGTNIGKFNKGKRYSRAQKKETLIIKWETLSFTLVQEMQTETYHSHCQLRKAWWASFERAEEPFLLGL